MIDEEPLPEFPSVCIEGYPLLKEHPFHVPWEKHIDDIRNMTVREDDIFFVAFPKAGTHWLWEVIYMLLEEKVVYSARAKEYLMMELVTVEQMDAEPSPRIFNTHMPFSMLPVKQIKEKGAKIIHAYRNPKDSFVSEYFHFGQLPILRHVSLHDFVRLILNNKMFFGNYGPFLKQMQEFMRNNPDTEIFNVSFEETKRHPLEVVKRLAKFLGKDLDEELLREITESCSFRNMKKHDENKEYLKGDKIKFDFHVYRKGEVGDWKNHLTVADSELIDRAIAEDLKDCDMFKIEYE